MKILITCTHYAVSSGRYAYDALKRLGHDVRSAGPAMGTEIWGMAVDEQYAWMPDVPEKDWTPDLTIHMDGNWKPDKQYGGLNVVYGVDNHVRDYRGVNYDHLFLAHGTGFRIGDENATWLPCGYDPVWFDGGPKLTERPMDVALVGVMYNTRAELLYALRIHAPGVSISYGTGAIYREYADAYRNAKISLVRSAGQDVAIRVWETAAMGCLLVMDWCHDCEALGLEHEKNCLIYHTPEEAALRVNWVMANPDEAVKIAKAGQAWAKPSTWDARLQVIVDWAEAQNKPKRASKPRKVESGENDSSS